MVILFFSKSLKGGGAERVLVNLTCGLVDRGHDVFIALNNNECIYKLPPTINVLADRERKLYAGKNIFKRFWRILRIQWNEYKFTRQTIQSVKPDIIVTFHLCNMLPIILFHQNIPIISSEHSAYDRELGIRTRFRRFFLNRFFNRVCVLTPFDQGYAKARGLKNTIVMPNPNTFSSLTADEYDDIFDKRKDILVCGRIGDWYVKGFDIAIQAFAEVRGKHKNLKLNIVGGLGTDQDFLYLKNLAEHLGVSDHVRFLGQRSDIKELMRQHMILLMTSRTEGFPMVVTEAMTQGLPCVSFTNLTTSIILHGIDGYHIDEVSQLPLAINYIIENKDVRRSLGYEAANNVVRFSTARIAEKWNDLFLELINK